MSKMTEKSELLEEIQALKESASVLIEAGVQYQKSFETAYKLLTLTCGRSPDFELREPELNKEIDDLLDQYELVHYPAYGLKVIPKAKT